MKKAILAVASLALLVASATAMAAPPKGGHVDENAAAMTGANSPSAATFIKGRRGGH